MRTLILLFGLSIFLSSCEKQVFQINEEVSIGYNSTIQVSTMDAENLEIKYTQLLSESRCPPGANCFDIGFVEVQLKLNDEQFVELSLLGSTPDSVVYNDHVIKLLAVEYDSDDDFGKEKKSSVVIRVD